MEVPDANDVGKLLELLRALEIPDARPRVLRTLVRRRRALPRPIVEIVGVTGHTALVGEIYSWLSESGGRRATPRVKIDLHAPDLPRTQLTPDLNAIDAGPHANDQEIPGHCLPIIQHLVAGFAADDTAMGAIKFPRYRTADWLTRQRVTSDESEAPDELRRRLPKLLRSGSPTSRSDTAEGVAGDTISRVVFGVLALWPVLRLWLWVSGRIPGMSKVTRWFLHQRYLAPELSGSFLGFASRLTASHRVDENEEQVAKLLVHAFLEDLRDAYRRRIWRPSSWRRTAYPVALLGGLAEGGDGARILTWINEIRNETGLFDPLVVVALRDEGPIREVGELSHISDLRPLRTLESLADTPSPQPPDPLQEWVREIDNRRTHRQADAWFLPLRAILPPDTTPRVSDARFRGLALPPAPPLAARSWFVGLCVLIPIVIAAAATLVYFPPLRGAQCSHWPWTGGVSVSLRGGECVGYSDNPRQTFADDPELSAMQREVFRLNAAASDARASNPNRPLVSLVYFAGLSYVDTNVRYPHAQVEELAGLAVQQRRALLASDESEPLLRIIIANGGSDMRHAGWVVDNPLRELVAEDPSVLGVVGIDRSNDETRRAITRLGELGVPAVATTLSADGLEEASPLYFQAAPSNRVQARLIADYVQGARDLNGAPRYDKVAIYHPEAAGDLYVTTLVEDVQKELTERGVAQESMSWREQQQLYRFPAPCETAGFGRRTLLFFAGRNDDFPTFAKSVSRGCLSGAGPAILGNDAVTRLITDPKATAALPANLTVRYVSKASPVMLGGADCVSGIGKLGGQPVPFEHEQLCTELAGLIEDLRGYAGLTDYRPTWAGDRTGLAFDVSGLFVQAVRNSRGVLADLPPNRTAIAVQLRESDYRGVTGTLGFSTSRVADGSSIAVLVTAAVGGSGPQRCLVMFPRQTGQDGCPSGTKSDLEGWIEPGR
ncbi:ABC transporter substrate-binding protein [Nocardia salmonicida]|uniref:ABC transporter substrate-binding protein n=1 Tax=Nocardia salmonicida TaxID=53431 RepID=UPI001FDFA852|nr:ABC transporter substrate-binding protein [Nocardia salmonicida]